MTRRIYRSTADRSICINLGRLRIRTVRGLWPVLYCHRFTGGWRFGFGYLTGLLITDDDLLRVLEMWPCCQPAPTDTPPPPPTT